MPPRKSTDSIAAKGADGEPAPAGPGRGRGQRNSDGLGVEDLGLPRSMVQRLAKGMLPANTSIQKDALLAMSKSATVFVNYLANNANDRAVLKNKRTIQPSDVFDALDELEFPNFLPRVKTELEIWNTAQCDKRNTYRRKIREGAAAKDGGEANGKSDGAANVNGTEGADEPAMKKARLSSGVATVDGDEDMMDDQDEGDDTIDENEGDDDDNMDEDEDIEDAPADVEDPDDGLEGDMDHNQRQDDEDGNESE